jgi:hypothetical protein
MGNDLFAPLPDIRKTKNPDVPGFFALGNLIAPAGLPA